MKHYFIFSDVHGEFDALIRGLKNEGFDREDEKHILVSLGDNFDRGNQNDKVYEFLLDMQREGRFIGIRGNHDEMLLSGITLKSYNLYWDWFHNGLSTTLDNLAKINCSNLIEDKQYIIIQKLIEERPNLERFLRSLYEKIEIGNYVLTHAGYINTFKIDPRDENSYFWNVSNWSNTPMFIKNFERDSLDYDKSKTYVFGHWHSIKLKEKFGQPKNNKIFRYKNFVGIDGLTNLTKRVNVLKISSKNVPEVIKYVIN